LKNNWDGFCNERTATGKTWELFRGQWPSNGRAMADMVARFDPKIVKMCGDGSKAED
jgi:hypothetical protein